AKPNVAPQVHITSPVNNANFTKGSNIEITAQAEAKDGFISRVEFYNGNTLLGTDTTYPYSFTWKDVPENICTIYAKVIDNESKTATSEKVIATVSSILNSIIDEILNNDIFPGTDFEGIYLNTGSGDTYNYNGHTFVGDKAKSSYYNSTTTFSNSSASKDQLLQTERNGKSLRYTIPVPNGTYTVTTYHNELYFGKSGPSAKAGRRVFDISLEGKLVKKSFDMFVENGNKTTVLVFQNVEVKDGKL